MSLNVPEYAMFLRSDSGEKFGRRLL